MKLYTNELLDDLGINYIAVYDTLRYSTAGYLGLYRIVYFDKVESWEMI